MADWIGRTLSDVIIIKHLGRERMADVYLGHHTTLDRQVAVKILHGFLAGDELVRERFRREAQAVAALRHANIVQVFYLDIVSDEGGDRPYIVMELLEGMPLNDFLRVLHKSECRLPPETTARLMVGLAAALDYAHARGIIHRDVKPANVFLRRDSGPIDLDVPLPLDIEPVLTDFCIARFLDATTLSGTGAVYGTPAYLSPEQARGQAVDQRSDIYSLGVMLYEMLAGRLPFKPSTEAPFSVVIMHLNEAPPPVLDLSSKVQAVLDRALAKDVRERYQKAGELAVDLIESIFGWGRVGAVSSASEERLPPLTGLLDTLELLASQARIYEHALPPNNYPARAAVATLGELGRRALNETRGLVISLEPSPPAPHPFSPREFEVLCLAAVGLTNKEIAYRLGISERTIQFHMNSIFNKSGTQSRTEAATLALQNGWISLSGK